MAIQDSLTDLYIKNVIIPKFVKYNSPGFVITEQNTKFGYTYQRDLFLSENLIADIETKFIQKFGAKGKSFLYGVGKNFGWNYGKSFNMPTIKTHEQKDVIEMAKFLSQFVGGTWAEKADIEKIDLNKKYFEIKFNDYVVCSKNGLGYLLNDGGISGLWGWLMADFNIEGVQTICQGRKSNECRTVCAPPEELKKAGLDFISFNDKIESDSASPEYLEYNKIRSQRYSSTTLRNLIDNNIVTYKRGKMEYQNERYLPLGIDFLFLLESQVSKLPNGSKLLYEIAFTHGQLIAQKETDLSPQFMSDFMSFQGWGDLLITSSLTEIGITFYPWHELYQQSKKEIFLGLLSGFVSTYKNKKIQLKITGESLSDGFVSMNLEVAK